MISDDDFQNLLNYAHFFLRFRPRTEKEMRDYLNKKILSRYWSRDDVDRAIAVLKEQNLINDKEFVCWFVDQRKSGNPKGKFVLRGELLRYGLDKQLIDNYLSENPLDEEALANQALISRWPRFNNLSKEKRWQKASQFLLRRGFGFYIIRKTIEKLEGMDCC